MTMLRTLIASFVLAVPCAVPLSAQEPPPALPPASPPPPAPATAPALVPPPANAVALCNDQTFVLPPAQPAACATRGGLKLVLPGARSAPPAAAPAARATTSAPPVLLRDDTPPAGATMRCRDGSWLSGTPSEARCDRNGGLAAILPAPRPPMPRVP